MFNPLKMISRRTILRLFASTPLAVAGFSRRLTAATVLHKNVQSQGYGIGTYSEGQYPGYRMYLPIVTRDE